VSWIRQHGYSWSVTMGGNIEASRDEIRHWLDRASEAHVSPAPLLNHRLQVSERFAQTVDRDTHPPASIFGLAAPVFDLAGSNVLHLTIQGFLSRVPPSAVEGLASITKAAALRVMAQIGGRAPRIERLASIDDIAE
jgi:DNA-binding IclR family transcriptional regulator